MAIEVKQDQLPGVCKQYPSFEKDINWVQCSYSQKSEAYRITQIALEKYNGPDIGLKAADPDARFNSNFTPKLQTPDGMPAWIWVNPETGVPEGLSFPKPNSLNPDNNGHRWFIDFEGQIVGQKYDHPSQPAAIRVESNK